MFGPDNKIFGNFYPAMLEQAVEADTIANQVYWRERSEQEMFADEHLYQRMQIIEGFRADIKDLRNRNWELKIMRANLMVERVKIKTAYKMLQVEHLAKMTSIKLKHQVRLTYLKATYYPAVGTIRQFGPEIAWMAGIGSATRMAFAAESHLLNGDLGKAAIAAGIGVASIAAPYAASKFFSNKKA